MYDTKKVTDIVTTDKILRILNEIDIYSYYAGKKLNINKPVRSPLRKDDNPSFGLFTARNGSIMWKDFTTGDSGNVFKFVQQKLSLKFNQALDQIWKDLISNGKGNPPKAKYEPIPRAGSIITVKRKPFTKEDDEYWAQYGYTREDVKFSNISPISRYWINDVEQPLKYSKGNPMYAFKIFNKFKIYKPYATNKANKWRNNCTSYDIQGFEQLPESGDLLIITKSNKDVGVLRKFGYNSVSPQSETATIPRVVFEHLQSRFKEIVIFFDYDEGGILGATKLSEKYGINKVFIPKHYLDLYGIKDISDFRKEMSKNKTKELLKELFDEKKTKSLHSR
jgi:DNA primase